MKLERVVWIVLSLVGFSAGFFLRTGDNTDATLSIAEEVPVVENEVGDEVGELAIDPEEEQPVESDTVIVDTEEVVEEPVESALSFRDSLVDILGRVDGTDRLLEFGGLLKGLSGENWREVLGVFVEQNKLYGMQHPAEWDLFVKRAGEIVGREAVDHFAETGVLNDAKTSLESWASKDPAGAFAWLEEDANRKMRPQILGAAIRGVAQQRPDMAIDLLETLDVGDRGKYSRHLVPIFVQALGIEETSVLLDGVLERSVALGEERSEYVSTLFNQLAWRYLNNARVQGEWSVAVEMITPHARMPYLNPAYVGEFVRGFATEDPVGALNWVGGLYEGEPDAVPNGVGYWSIMDEWSKEQGIGAVNDWMSQNVEHPHFDRLAGRHAQHVYAASKDFEVAMSWVNQISDATRRQRAAGYLKQMKKRE